MKDCDGWPIVPGARVRIEHPTLFRVTHTDRCPRLGSCGCPRIPSARNGKVRSIVENPPSGRPYVDVVEFETFNTLTPSPSACRVMRGKTNSQRRHEMLTDEGKMIYRRRKSA